MQLHTRIYHLTRMADNRIFESGLAGLFTRRHYWTKITMVAPGRFRWKPSLSVDRIGHCLSDYFDYQNKQNYHMSLS